MDELWEETETMKKSIKALQDLFNERASVPSATVQTLLYDTRPHRNVWLRGAVSIHTIWKDYQTLCVPKWVRMHKSGLLTVAFNTTILLWNVQVKVLAYQLAAHICFSYRNSYTIALYRSNWLLFPTAGIRVSGGGAGSSQQLVWTQLDQSLFNCNWWNGQTLIRTGIERADHHQEKHLLQAPSTWCGRCDSCELCSS